MASKLDESEWRLDCLNSRMDALCELARFDGEMRSWKIRGLLAGGKEGTKIVQARDHSEATLKGTKQPPVMVVRDVVLQDSRSDIASAEQERKWIIRGKYPNGNRLEFSVLAYDHAEAKKKAEAKKGTATITDVVLKD